MITINNLSKNLTQRTLFKDVTLSINSREKIGLTGPNGTGKSTLFNIILGEMEASSGGVQLQKNLNIGYLPQEAKFTSERTLIEEVTSGDDRIKKLLKEKHELEDENKADSPRYGDILAELETAGFYELEHKAEKVLTGLGFKMQDFEKPIMQLSGGWQMRALLAKLLIYPYDVILLDEPTNYLDLSATLWLKDFLASYQGTFVIISHDKVFLNDVTNYTIVLENGRITKVKGNYEAFEEQKGVEYKTLEKRQKVVEKKREQLEKFTQRFHAQPNRASAVRNKQKMIERLEEIELPQERRSIKDFEFPVTQQSGYTVLTMSHVSKSYGEKKIYTDLNLEIVKGQKVCLVGPNGAGKSTMLKMAAGVLEPDGGTVRLGHQVTRGYFSQTRLDVLNPQNNVLDELASVVHGSCPPVKMRSLLGLFNFHGEDVFKPVSVLSGGEKSRLILAKLLINPPNFILLDEPTTHLDIDGVEALTTAFQRYEGTLCFISHDLFFVREIADCIIEVDQGQYKTYPGGLDYYLDKKKMGETLGQQSEAKVKQEKDREKEEKRKKQEVESQKVQDLRQQHRQATKRLEDIKNQIKQLEKEKQDIETESYVKARVLGNAFGKDPNLLKEYGKRLKEIPIRLREIESTVKQLKEERDQINQ
ncbi:MAG: ATP-binding cassette domain-containing protein [Candidatus Omnitrophica bacterium]|nr:ATP-binding cassette domain-containing protein [Candidatus Omnitrophota bacterium]